MQIWSHAQKFFIWIQDKKKVKDIVAFIVQTMRDERIIREMNEQEGKISFGSLQFKMIGTNMFYRFRWERISPHGPYF